MQQSNQTTTTVYFRAAIQCRQLVCMTPPGGPSASLQVDTCTTKSTQPCAATICICHSFYRCHKQRCW